jgi:hypothetical protein
MGNFRLFIKNHLSFRHSDSQAMITGAPGRLEFDTSLQRGSAANLAKAEGES